MPLRIWTLETDPIPRPLNLELVCDACDGMFISVASWQADSFIEAWDKAMRAGWKETRSEGERQFECPACSGKKVEK